MNIRIVAGRVKEDPVIKSFDSGHRVARFQIPTAKAKNGPDGKSQYQWHNIEVYDPKLIDNVVPHIKKGKYVMVRGMHESRSYKHKSGGYPVHYDYIALNSRGEITFEAHYKPENSQKAEPAPAQHLANDMCHDMPFVVSAQPDQ